MDYKDPIATAKEILEGEYKRNLEEDATSDETLEDLLDDDDLFEAKKSEDEVEEDEDDEDEDDDEVKEGKVPPAFLKKAKGKDKGDDDDSEDSDEDEVDEGELPPWLKKKGKKNGKKNGKDDDEDLDEAETILDVEDNQAADGKKATKTAKGKKKAKEPKSSPSDASSKIDTIKKVKEDMEVLFDGEDLSEEFQEKATTIFEAAISTRVNEIEDELREDHDTVVSESVESIRKELTERLDDYLGYVVEEWMETNELAIERGIRGDIAENFIHGLKGLFESCYVDVPNEKYDLIDGMATKIEQLEGQVNEEMENNISLRKEVLEHRCEEVFNETTEGLVDTEVEKLRSLAEGVEFESEKQYKDKLNILKESYFDKSNPESSNYDETGMIDENTKYQNVDGVMGKYVQSLSQQLKDK
jgi:hypothetical protein